MTTDSAVVVVSPKADGVHGDQDADVQRSDEYVVTFADAEVPTDVLRGRRARTGSTSWRWPPPARSPPVWSPGRCG